MTKHTSYKSLLSRIGRGFVGLVVIIVILISVKFLSEMLWRSTTRPRVISAIKATFPNFCTDGHIVSDLNVDLLEILFTNYADYDNHWPIVCDSWTVHLVATFVDINTCMTMDPVFYNKNGEYAAEIKSMSNQKLAFCP